MAVPESVEDHRLGPEKDCDRILYSSAFRRLTGVTQVTAVREVPLFHNRLTHTLKVATLAERLAQDLIRSQQVGSEQIDPNVAKAAGMAHDLGHPPFGHIAEEILQAKCTAARIDGFEGNAQSFRIITKLARRASSEPGLGLGVGTLNAVLKYPWMRLDEDPGDNASVSARHHWRKWGAYKTEQAEFATARQGDVSEMPDIHAQIMDWCDDVSYALHDIEDFYRAGLLPLERLDSDRNQLLANSAVALKDNPDFNPDHLAEAMQRHAGAYWPSVPYDGSDAARRSVHQRTNELIDGFFRAVRLSRDGRRLLVDPVARHEVMLLKQLTWQYVINSPSLATLQHGQQKVVAELFDALVHWLIEEKAPHRFPARLRRLREFVQRDSEATGELADERQRAARVAADYIAGLTEDQAIDLYERFSGLSSKSILEGWLAW